MSSTEDRNVLLSTEDNICSCLLQKVLYCFYCRQSVLLSTEDSMHCYLLKIAIHCYLLKVIICCYLLQKVNTALFYCRKKVLLSTEDSMHYFLLKIAIYCHQLKIYTAIYWRCTAIAQIIPGEMYYWHIKGLPGNSSTKMGLLSQYPPIFRIVSYYCFLLSLLKFLEDRGNFKWNKNENNCNFLYIFGPY